MSTLVEHISYTGHRKDNCKRIANAPHVTKFVRKAIEIEKNGSLKTNWMPSSYMESEKL